MSLKTELHQRIMIDMIEKARGTSKALVLILDSYTSKIVSSSCRMYDLMEAGIVVIEKLSLNRQRLDLPAIYFIHPTNDSIDRLIGDFKDAKRPQYETVHLFFTQRVKKDFMTKLGACNPLVKRIKNFVELNIDFIALESRVFTLNRPRTIPLLYFPPNTQVLSDELTAISKQLVSLFLTLKEFPYVRYSSAARNGICKGLAQFFEDDMKKVIGQLPNWKASETRERGTLLIVDRSIDPAAPLMHEYTYQAMVCDLLKVQGELYYRKTPKSSSSSSSAAASGKDEKSNTSGDNDKNPVVLSEDDPLWLDFRHKHIGEVMHDITEKFREFKGKNKMAQMQSEENATVKQMLQAMKDMPEYKQMMQKYHKHMSLAEDCMRRFEKKKLKELGELEQDMATGLGEDGKTVVVKNLKTSLVKMCQDPQIGILEKLRLMMIFIISQGGVQDAIRKELMKPIHIDLQKAIRNLEKLGVDLSVVQGNKPKQNKQRLEQFAKRSKTIPLALMRYVPYLQSVIESLVQYELDEEKFPYTAPPPAGAIGKASAAGKNGKSARKGKAGDWKKGGAGGESKDDNELPGFDDDDRPLFVIFVLGGITFSELRSAYEIAAQSKTKLIIGSTNTLIASEYIRELADISNNHFKSALKQPPADGSQQVIDSDLENDDKLNDDDDEDNDETIGSEKVALRIADSD